MKTLWISLVFLALSAVAAQAQAPKMERYSRPSILTAPPIAHDMGGAILGLEIQEDWDLMRDAQFSFAVQLLNLYHDHEIYFLARDAETLYDAAVLVSNGRPEDLERLHLLNVSRANMDSPHLRSYLAQEGISREALLAGKKVLLVDTGFMGSISEVIESQFPSELRPQISTHLLVSGISTYPLSRVFLSKLDQPIDFFEARQFQPIVLLYEQLPSFTDRSTEYSLVDGRWEAMSPMDVSSTDGQVSKTRARHMQEDLHAHFGQFRVQRMIQKEAFLWRRLMHIYYGPATRPQKLAMVRAFLAEREDKELREAMVRDVIERDQTSGVPVSSAGLRLSELRLYNMYEYAEESTAQMPSAAALYKGQCLNLLVKKP